MTLLQTRRLGKSFGGLRAVDEVDLAVEAGSIFGIIGPNGAGKTTFFNLISRALPATTGTIAFDGHDVTSLEAHQVARRGMARMVVVLPAPFGPMKPKISPWFTSKLTSRKTSRFP